MSFVYGALPSSAFGEGDVWSGLRVSLLTGSEARVEVSYADVALVRVPAELRRADFVSVGVSYGSGGLSVVYDGVLLVSNLTVPRWHPERGWRFGFGARTSASADEHGRAPQPRRADPEGPRRCRQSRRRAP